MSTRYLGIELQRSVKGLNSLRIFLGACLFLGQHDVEVGTSIGQRESFLQRTGSRLKITFLLQQVAQVDASVQVPRIQAKHCQKVVDGRSVAFSPLTRQDHPKSKLSLDKIRLKLDGGVKSLGRLNGFALLQERFRQSILDDCYRVDCRCFSCRRRALRSR